MSFFILCTARHDINDQLLMKMTESEYMFGGNFDSHHSGVTMETMIHPVSPTSNVKALHGSFLNNHIHDNAPLKEIENMLTMGVNKADYIPNSMTSTVHTNMPHLHTLFDSSLRNHGVFDAEKNFSLLMTGLPVTLREAHCIFAFAQGVDSIEVVPSSDVTLALKAMEEYRSLPEICKVSVEVKFQNPSYLSQCAFELFMKLESIKEQFGGTKLYLGVYEHQTDNYLSMSNLLAGTNTDGSLHDENIGKNMHFSSSDSHIDSMVQSSPIQSLGKLSRPNLFPRRSRFSFGDPFNSETVPDTSINMGLGGDTSLNSLHQMDGINSRKSTSRDTGKALLLMENDEINENIWGTDTLPTTVDDLPLTSGANTTDTGVWKDEGNKGVNHNLYLLPESKTSNKYSTRKPDFADENTHVFQNGSALLPEIHGAQNDQLNGGASNANGSFDHQTFSNISHQPSNNYVNNLGPSDMGSITRVEMTNNRNQDPYIGTMTYRADNFQDNLVHNDSTIFQSNTDLTKNVMVDNKMATNGNKPGLSPSQSFSSANGMGYSEKGMSQADLSLLAKVPPPANPADQNPPCNTLYVGNLPPDTSEQELRQLFSPQPGFRRLSFKNKNNNGHTHGHGPMCFVEFEDVSFATRALAELYGRQLPRTGANSKGGIRLSFSKNPLGVRGPNNRKMTSIGKAPNSYKANYMKN